MKKTTHTKAPTDPIRRAARWAILSTALAAPAIQAGIIDFEGFTDNTQLSNQVPDIIFTDATVFTAGISLNDIDFPPYSGVNVAVSGITGGGTGIMSLTFLTPLSFFSAYFTFFEPLTLQAFDSGNNLLGTVLSVASDVSGSWEKIAFGFSDIASVTITGNSQFTMDDLALPEPSTFLLFGAAGLAGAGLRSTGKRGSSPGRNES